MYDELTLLLATYIGVLGRVFQQKNVIGDHRILLILTSYVIAAGEVLVIYQVAKVGLSAIPWVGTGGALGALSAIMLHDRITNKGVTTNGTDDPSKP